MNVCISEMDSFSTWARQGNQAISVSTLTRLEWVTNDSSSLQISLPFFMQHTRSFKIHKLNFLKLRRCTTFQPASAITRCTMNRGSIRCKGKSFFSSLQCPEWLKPTQPPIQWVQSTIQDDLLTALLNRPYIIK
jgi:hypothetical protein